MPEPQEHPSDDHVWILGLPSDEDGGDRAEFFRPSEARIGRQRVPTQALQDNVDGFVRAMARAIAGVPGEMSGYSIESIEISAEVSASGKVALLGTGGELAGKGGISFTLKRVKTA